MPDQKVMILSAFAEPEKVQAVRALGAGRQGTAAAYDLARFGSAKEIKFADQNEQAARTAAQRINQLIFSLPGIILRCCKKRRYIYCYD